MDRSTQCVKLSKKAISLSYEGEVRGDKDKDKDRTGRVQQSNLSPRNATLKMLLELTILELLPPFYPTQTQSV